MAELLGILMQRSDPAFPWGFSVKSNEVSQVTSGTLAALHLAPGDKILEINKMKTRQMSQNEIEAYINGSCKSLDLLIIKGTDSHETADFKESRSEASLILQDRRESQDSWDSGLARSTLNKRDRESSKRNKETLMQTELAKAHNPKSGTLQEYGNESSSAPVKRRDSRYDQWLQNPDNISRKHASEETKQLKSKKEPLQKKEYFYEGSEHLNDCEKEEFTNRKSESTNCRVSNDTKANYKDKYTNTIFAKQQEKTSFRESPQRRFTESSGCKLGNRRSLNIDELKKNGFGANTEIPHFFTRYDYPSKSNRWFTGSNDDSVINQQFPMESRLNDSRRAWIDKFLSENLKTTKSSKSELKQSITTVNESYSTHDGENAHETHEELNITKETEEHVKIVDGNKEEVTKKVLKNEEYTLTNKDTKNETKKTVKDYSIAKSILRNGEKEFSNKITNHSEETVNSLTSSCFQDKNKEDLPKNPSTFQSKYCNDSIIHDNDGNYANISDSISKHYDSTDESSIYFSPIKTNGIDRTSSNDKTRRTSDVWDPPLSRVGTPLTNYKQHLDERQGDITFWEVSPERKSNKTRSSSPGRKYKRNNSDFSYGYSSLTSECSSLPNSDLRNTETFEMNKTILKRPKDFLSEDLRGNVQRGKIKIPSAFSKTNGTTTEHNSSKHLPTMTKIIPKVEKTNSSKTSYHIGSSKDTKEINTRVLNRTENNHRVLNPHETCEIAKKNSNNGESSKIKKSIYDFEIVDRISKEENKKYLDFRERSKGAAYPACSTDVKDDIQDCAFKFPLNNEFTFPSNLNQNGLENITINSPPLSEDQLHVFVGKHIIKHSSDLEDDVFLTSPSLSPVANEVLQKNNPRTNNTSGENQKHSHIEEMQPTVNLNDQSNLEESPRTPLLREDDLLTQPVNLKFSKESEIGLNTQYVNGMNPKIPKEDPFKFWLSNLRNQDNQNQLLHLMTPKPFLGHIDQTVKMTPSSKTEEE